MRSVVILSSSDKSEYNQIRILRDNQIYCYSSELILATSLSQKMELNRYMLRENGKQY